MNSHVAPDKSVQPLKNVTMVSDFAKRYRLCKDEENRLIKLFGFYAAKHELLMNARRLPAVR